MKKIFAVVSGGGHWLELRRIYPVFEGAEVVFACVHPDYADQVPGHRYYTVCDLNRWRWWRSLPLAFELFSIMAKERPDIIVTTGAAPGLVALALGKVLFRKKTMWIDSIANCRKLSMSGRIACYFADAWLTQWPELEGCCGARGPRFWGAVI